jgi:hypothetical protein
LCSRVRGEAGAMKLAAAIERLRRHYGPPERPPTVDPFELVLLENVAYLAPPSKRREAFLDLQRSIGTSPAALLKARPRDLESVTARGILKKTFAAKLRECARIAAVELGGDVQRAAGPGPARLRARRGVVRSHVRRGSPGRERAALATAAPPGGAPAPASSRPDPLPSPPPLVRRVPPGRGLRPRSEHAERELKRRLVPKSDGSRRRLAWRCVLRSIEATVPRRRSDAATHAGQALVRAVRGARAHSGG